MFTWWGLYKSVPYELALKIDGRREPDCVELQEQSEPVKGSAVEAWLHGRQGEANGRRSDA